MAEPRNVGIYRLGRTLGEGTYGKVKLGFNMMTGQEVAVKILSPEAASDRKSIDREVSILKLLQHPNIVRLYDVIQEDSSGRVYLILELVSGGELFDYIVARGRVQEKEARRFFRQVLSGLEYCHANLICHRDLKPENILLDSSGNVKINDFGFSNMIRPGKLFTTFCGSPIYAPPEIILEKAYNGPEVDVWSFGVILYALVTGQLPWRLGRNSRIEDIDDLLRGSFEFPRGVVLSRDVQDLIRKMVVADGKKRATIEQIKNHPWTREGYTEPVNPCLPPRPPVTHIRDDIMDQLGLIGFNIDEAKKQILAHQPCPALNVYYLLCEKSPLPTPAKPEAGPPTPHQAWSESPPASAAAPAPASAPAAAPATSSAHTAVEELMAISPPRASPISTRRRRVSLNITPPRSPLPDSWAPPVNLVPVLEEDEQANRDTPTHLTASMPIAPFDRAAMDASTKAPPVVTKAKPRRHSYTDSRKAAAAVSGGSAAPAPATEQAAAPGTPKSSSIFSRIFTKKKDGTPVSPDVAANSPAVPAPAAEVPTTPTKSRRLSLGPLGLLGSSSSKGNDKLRTVKGAFNVDTTTTKPPSEVVREIGRALTSANMEFKQRGYVYKVKATSTDPEDKEGARVHFEMEVCSIAGLDLNGVKFKRTAGSVWAYREICVNLVKEMKL
eukprot:TRINITY_DN11256_c0_g1_i4.p1 TRINITY_DN11256_c0_g1~~TRINITY_DN11256_c0_g1_i4.p1  ORF type:complete len:695 (-),score=161.73 TRINITY_DN11256_c0_g1_i4:9-2012(-)